MLTGLLERTALIPSPARSPEATRSRWLRPGDRDVLWLYAASRIGLWALAHCARWVFSADGGVRHPAGVLTPFERWDWTHFLAIAKNGYFPGRSGPWQAGWDHREAFFPGFPACLRLVHFVVPDWTVAGLLVSFVAGAVAVLALARIAEQELADAAAGRRAALLLLLSPCAVFLALGYSESLFLAFALPAWLAARRGDWGAASLLAAFATAVRVSGLFLVAALVVQFVVAGRARRATWRQWCEGLWFLFPFLPVAHFHWYLYTRTGDWSAWTHAQQKGWGREFYAPWETWQHTWNSAFSHTQPISFAAEFQLELCAAVAGLLLLAVLTARRRWAEAVYVLLNLAALASSFWYMSVPRATLLWWPLWIVLAKRSLASPRFTTGYLTVVAPLSTVVALAFFSGRWSG
ncbi:hypothetical protein GCM10020229_72280 [Kitasatospora albolonga]|uniref:mannosyltransferase family protein n=1 Tax=Kitasatospora albolonga TaxID=68173 RepID=UPI0031F033D2